LLFGCPQDDKTRTVTFTQNSGLPGVNPITLQGRQEIVVQIPQGWSGNCQHAAAQRTQQARTTERGSGTAWLTDTLVALLLMLCSQGSRYVRICMHAATCVRDVRVERCVVS